MTMIGIDIATVGMTGMIVTKETAIGGAIGMAGGMIATGIAVGGATIATMIGVKVDATGTETTMIDEPRAVEVRSTHLGRCHS